MKPMEQEEPRPGKDGEEQQEKSDILEEVVIEDLTVDGICGVY